MRKIDADKYRPKVCTYCGSKDIIVNPIIMGQNVDVDPEEFLKSDDYVIMRGLLKKDKMDTSRLYRGELWEHEGDRDILPIAFGVICLKCRMPYLVKIPIIDQTSP